MTIKTYFIFICYLFTSVLCKMPQVYYANLGGQARLQCNANLLCYSTYTFQNTPHAMLALNSSLKYQIAAGFVTINNIKDTDAGFYTCSSVCNQMKSDQISYFVHPVAMGQPLDLSKSWVAIPPIPDSSSNDNMDNYFVVVSDERLYAAKNAKLLSDGEIAGLVIGLFFGLLLTAAVIVGLILLNRRRTKNNREKMLTSKRSDKDTASSIDYSTIERDFPGESATNTLTRDSNNRMENEPNRKKSNQNDLPIGNLKDIVSEIKTKDIEGPRSYRVDNFNSLNDMMNNQGDLPNIDIGSGNSYQNQLFDNFKEDKPPSPPKNQYVNQPLIQFPQINSRKPLNQAKENRLDSLSELDSTPKLDGSHPNIASAIAGAVTVVSARTPAVREQQRPSVSSNQSAKQNPSKHISFSQRIETTSTPFQLHVPPSQSFREVDYTTNYFKDGATDV